MPSDNLTELGAPNVGAVHYKGTPIIDLGCDIFPNN